MKKLPNALGREPLIDALFEVRFKSVGIPLADVLPGFLMGSLEPKPAILRLPTSEIPSPVRAADPTLRYMPVQRLDWNRYYISFGDNNIIINCKLPYPKWPAFKATILDLMNRISQLPIPVELERYSLKYINLIPSYNALEQANKIDMKIQLGNVAIKGESLSLQVQREEKGMLHILTVVVGAQVLIAGSEPMSGAIVDIDSIRNLTASGFNASLDVLIGGLEELRQRNKVLFFDCLTDDAIAEMEPVYA